MRKCMVTANHDFQKKKAVACRWQWNAGASNVSHAPAEYSLTSVDLPDFDMTDQGQVEKVIVTLQPEVIINCAAYTNVDGCES